MFPLDKSKELKQKNKKNPLRPYLISLLILGINLTDSNGTVMKILSLFYSSTIFLLYHYWAVSDIIWYFQNPIDEIALADSVTVWASVGTWDFFFLKRKEFLKIIKIVQQETAKLSSTHQKVFRRRVLVTCVLAWMFVLIYIGQFNVFDLHVDYKMHFSNSPLYSFPDHLNQAQMDLAIKIDKSFESFFIQGSLAVIVSLYTVLCINAKMWFTRFGQQFKKSSWSLSVLQLEDIKKFRTIFDRFSRRVEMIDNVFSRIVAVWLLMILVTLCVRTLSVLNAETFINNQMIAMSALELSRAVMTLLSVSLLADGVHRESLFCIGELQRVQSKSSDLWNASVYHEIQMAFTKFTFFPTHLTVWKFSPLNRAFLMTCIGVMITYVVICIQLNPSALETFIG